MTVVTLLATVVTFSLSVVTDDCCDVLGTVVTFWGLL